MKTTNQPIGKITSKIVDDATSLKESQVRDVKHDTSAGQNLAALEIVRQQNEMIARLEAKKERALMKGKCSF